MDAAKLIEKYIKKLPVSADWAQNASQYMPGGDTHGHFFNPPFHTAIDHGEGCYLYDVDGNRYIDFANSAFCLIHGHCFPPVTQALEEQIKRGTTFMMPTELQIGFAQLLCQRIPSLDEVRFVSSGSEATNMDMRAARAHTGRRKIMKVDGGYHGTHNIGELNSFGASKRGECSANPDIGTNGSEINDVILFPWNDIEFVRRIIQEKGEEVAALIIEPVLVVGGVIEPAPGFLENIRQLTQDHGIVLIFDEVVTLPFSYHGMQGDYGVTPDLTTMGKGIGGGLPIGAWGGKRDILEMWNPLRGHGDGIITVSTSGGNAITMAAGLSAMTHLTPEIIQSRNSFGDTLRSEMNATFKRNNIKAHISGSHSVFWVHFGEKIVKDPYDSLDALQLGSDNIRNLLFMGMRYRGVYLFPSPSIFGNISTPIRQKEIDNMIQALDETLNEIRPVIETECPHLVG